MKCIAARQAAGRILTFHNPMRYQETPTMRHPRAFTLIELLVVISIIVLLIAILLPVLSKSRASARLALCATNLQQLGVANISYSVDNDGYVMKTHERHGNAYAFDIRKKQDDPSQPNAWAIKGIEPYIRSFSGPFVALEGAGIALCPDVDKKLMDKFYSIRNSGHDFIEIQYGYFGGVDQIQKTAPWAVKYGAEDLLMKSIYESSESNRVWMSDILYRDASDKNKPLGAWRYNHGENGWAFNEYDWMPNQPGPVPLFTGINQLYGDGSVKWKPQNAFENVDQMLRPNYYRGPSLGASDVAYF